MVQENSTDHSVEQFASGLAEVSINHRPATNAEIASSNLVHSLIAASEKDRRLVKSTPHTVDVGGEKRVIRSWKMNEYKYKVQPCPFPTLARGFFTEQMTPHEGDSNNEDTDEKEAITHQAENAFHRIVARGYDKFFNISEVPWTTWDSIEANTSPPYVLTLKSNGCIIFMSALTPKEIVVMSKHSIGATKDREVSHAQMGDKWLDRHLEIAGQSREDLAKWLWDENLTAVAELCDDSFEEHVLAYPKETTGLHLHGLNRNRGTFETLPTDDVDAFARKWGFIVTATEVLQSAREVKEFTDQVERAGKWNGEPVEGFVVRTKVAQPSDSLRTARRDVADSPPYPPGSDFFFKIKFDEPYMTYRDWREITRCILAHRKKKDPGSLRVPKSKLRRPESYLYRAWVENEIDTNIGTFAGFNEGKGIIATRERFLKWMAEEQGQIKLSEFGKETKAPSQSQGPKKGEWERVAIVPVAVPGCGKTALGIALSELFNLGHTQSDDIPGKSSAPKFLQSVEDCFKAHNIVYADRNNHLTKHRTEIRDRVRSLDKPKPKPERKGKGRQYSPPPATQARSEEFPPLVLPPIKVFAIKWEVRSLSGNDGYEDEEAGEKANEMLRICNERIRTRGPNHQRLVYGPDHERVLWTFIRDSQPIDRLDGADDDEVDDLLKIDVTEEDTLEADVRKVADRLVELVKGLKRPTDDEVKSAVEAARAYQVVKRLEEEGKKPMAPRYFGIVPEVNLDEIISEAILCPPADDEQSQTTHATIQSFFEHLRNSLRITINPHITIVHSKETVQPEFQSLWNRCMVVRNVVPPPLFTFRFGEIVTDGDIMALSVLDLGLADGVEDVQEIKDMLDEISSDLRNKLHVTVGTKDDSIKPFVAGPMVLAWRTGKASTDVKALPLKSVPIRGTLRGLSS